MCIYVCMMILQMVTNLLVYSSAHILKSETAWLAECITLKEGSTSAVKTNNLPELLSSRLCSTSSSFLGTRPLAVTRSWRSGEMRIGDCSEISSFSRWYLERKWKRRCGLLVTKCLGTEYVRIRSLRCISSKPKT